MDAANRNARIDQLFSDVCDMDPQQRGAFLDESCGDDESEIRREVEKLLDADDRVSRSNDSFLPVGSVSVSNMIPLVDAADNMVGQRIGHYVVQEHIGAGGFAHVFLATRSGDYEQQVALKLINTTIQSRDEILTRFAIERQVLASLAHPNIARLQDAGNTDDGHPYLVMEYVDGSSITAYCEQRALSIRRRLELFQQVCRAVAYAHQRGVMHRDLKPDNILVTKDGVPKLVDFGVAKLIDAGASDSRMTLTRTGQAPLTPAFASPEHIRGEPVTTCSDVYSLGVVLYVLLAGRLPYDLSACSAARVERIVCDLEPPLPSTAVLQPKPKGSRETTSPGRDAPERLRRKLRGDLDMIVMMALRKEATRRYSSAAELADDIQLYLDGRPVIARHNSSVYRLAKLIRRNKAVTAATLLTVIAVLVGFVATIMSLNHANRQRDAANARATELRRTGYNLALARAGDNWFRDPLSAARLLDNEEHCPPELRDFTWRFFRNQCRRDRSTLRGHNGAVRSVAFSPDGQSLVSGGRDGQLRFWLADKAQPVATLNGHSDWITSVVFSPDGKFVASAGFDRVVNIWNVEDRQLGHTFRGHSDIVTSLAFSPDGEVIASAGYDETVRIWCPQSGQEKAVLRGHDDAVLSLAFSPDQRWLASGGKDRVIRIWDLEAHEQAKQLNGHGRWHDWILSLAFSPDGKTLASSGYDKTIFLWDVHDNWRRKTLQDVDLPGHKHSVGCIVFSPNGRRLASSGDDMSIRLWDVETRRQLTTFTGHSGQVRSLCYSPDGRTLASAGYDALVKIWKVTEDLDHIKLCEQEDVIFDVAYSPDGEVLASAGADSTIRLWDKKTRRLSAQLHGHTDSIRTVVFSPNGSIIASGGDDNTIRLWNRSTGELMVTLTGHTGRVEAVLFCPDGETLVSASRDHSIRVWSLKSNSEMRVLLGHDDSVKSIALAPDHRTLVSASHDQTVRLWDLTTYAGTSVVTETDGVGSVAFSPDGTKLAYATVQLRQDSQFEPRIVLLDTRTWTPERTLLGHRKEVLSITFSPDGETLASGSADRTVRVWDARTGQERASLAGHTKWVGQLSFSPDGSTLASAGYDGTVRQWEGRSPEVQRLPPQRRRSLWKRVIRGIASGTTIEVRHRLAFRKHQDGVGSLAITSNNELIASASRDGSIIVWNTHSGKANCRIQAHDSLANVGLSPDGKTLISTGRNGDGWSVRTWDIATGERTASYPVNHRLFGPFSWNPRETLMAASIYGHGVSIFDFSRFEESITLKTGQAMVRFSADGSLLASCGLGGIDVWSTKSWDRVTSIRAHHDSIRDVAISQDGTMLATCSNEAERPIALWAIPSGKRLACLYGHRDWVTSLDISPDNRTLASASGGYDATVKLWDVPSGQEILSLPGASGQLALVRFSSDGRMLITKGQEWTLNVWDMLPD